MIRLLLFSLVGLTSFFGAWGQDMPRVLNLQECIDIAIENNLTVRRGELNLETAKINLTQSRAAQLPSANLSGNAGANFGRSIDPTTNQFITQQINAAGFGGSSGLVLFNGFQ
ncbi:MAG: TolC family protein, partial [Cyclobacteriaceae bacterium]|nr:TolC family protein [Cyclobacteriaceae bacterium]